MISLVSLHRSGASATAEENRLITSSNISSSSFKGTTHRSIFPPLSTTSRRLSIVHTRENSWFVSVNLSRLRISSKTDSSVVVSQISFNRKVFDEFEADKIVVLGRNGDHHRLEKSKRPVSSNPFVASFGPSDNFLVVQDPRSKSIVVTTRKTVQNAGLKSEDPILREEWVFGIQAIARAYERFWPQLAQGARKWELDILTGVGKDVGNVLWKLYGKGKHIRSNLVYAGEKVRTGEVLPEPRVSYLSILRVLITGTEKTCDWAGNGDR